MSSVTMKLERYRFGAPTPVEAMGQVTTLTYVQDVSGRDDMKFSILGNWDTARSLFLPGDYAALKDTLGRALSWGRVLTRTTTVSRQLRGDLTSQPYPVTVAGWWDFFSRAAIHVLLGDVSGAYANSIGTVYPVTAWQDFVAELTSSFASSMGAQLSFAFRRLGRLRVPETLGGGFLGDLIPIVYDDETAERFAPAFKGIEPVDSGYLLPDRLTGQFGTLSTTVGSFLTSTFVPEPSIIELFPALVDGGTEPYNGLAAALGRRPVLVYRIKPWREEPLWRNAVAKATYTPEDFELAFTDPREDGEADRVRRARIESKGRNRQFLVDAGIFSKVTLDTGDIASVTPIPEKYIHRIQSTVDDAVRMNAATIRIAPGGSDEIDTLDSASLPIIIDDQVEKHGLRLNQSRWPLVAPDGSADAEYYRTVAAQVMQFGAMNHVLESGMMDLHYTAASRVIAEDPDNQTRISPVLDVAHGRWFRTKVGPLPEYLGYIVALQHVITRSTDGTLSARTTIQFVRGHYADVGDLVAGVTVPIGKTPAAPAPTVTAGIGEDDIECSNEFQSVPTYPAYMTEGEATRAYVPPPTTPPLPPPLPPPAPAAAGGAQAVPGSGGVTFITAPLAVTDDLEGDGGMSTLDDQSMPEDTQTLVPEGYVEYDGLIYGPLYDGAPDNLVPTSIPRAQIDTDYPDFELVGPDPTLFSYPLVPFEDAAPANDYSVYPYRVDIDSVLAPEDGLPAIPAIEQRPRVFHDPSAPPLDARPWLASERTKGPWVDDEPSLAALTSTDCVTPTPRVTVSAAPPTVDAVPPPQARGFTNIAADFVNVLRGRYFVYRGAPLPVQFDVVQSIIPTNKKDHHGAYVGYRKQNPSACMIHTNDGPSNTTAQSCLKSFATRILKDNDGVAAHIIVDPAGTIYQAFDLATQVFHTSTPWDKPGEVNLTSVSIEFLVPRPARNAEEYKRRVEAGPWPGVGDWVFYFSKLDDATDAYFPRGRQYGFIPTAAQLSSFRQIASAFTSFGWFAPGAVPRLKDKPNSARRANAPSVAKAWYHNPLWTYFHHAQLERSRSDALGVDIIGVLGLDAETGVAPEPKPGDDQ